MLRSSSIGLKPFCRANSACSAQCTPLYPARLFFLLVGRLLPVKTSTVSVDLATKGNLSLDYFVNEKLRRALDDPNENLLNEGGGGKKKSKKGLLHMSKEKGMYKKDEKVSAFGLINNLFVNSDYAEDEEVGAAGGSTEDGKMGFVSGGIMDEKTEAGAAYSSAMSC